MEPNNVAPPPWSLTGDGLVLLYHIPQGFNRQYGFMADFQHEAYRGWVGAVVLADYKTSGVRPYRELLYLPGLFRIGGSLTFSISRIFVSTSDSVRNGQRNWGIPKELASFEVSSQPDGMQTYRIGNAGNNFFEARVKPWGPRFPFSSRLIPFTHITQQLHNQLLRTRPVASGSARVASLEYLAADPKFFPPVHQLKPLLSFYLPGFRMTFPAPRLL
ncbi:hypothetical protein GCM10023188_33150 [Pontibacter saemangeumensis]|uniref:Acetoacetate decarboxylase (ADC) n=1 Tax=Pontibacter saemangeumensis TaxID=1084525 RepID=A0ABP8LWH8_9BACT